MQKASQPDIKIASDEYFKALNDLKKIRFTPSSSQSLLINEKSFKDPDQFSKITFEEWLGRKSELVKASKKAQVHLKRQKDIEKKRSDEKKFQKQVQGEVMFKKWKKIKKIQHSSTEKLREKQKNAQEKFVKIKKQVAKEIYYEWLRHSLQALKEQKSQEKRERVKIEADLKKKDLEKMTKAQQAQKAYKDWLGKKEKVKKLKIEKEKKQFSSKKVLMLAYSPNRKQSFSLSSPEELTCKIFSNQNTCRAVYENTKQYSSKKLSQFTSQIRSEDYKVFDELSSIRKSPKVQSTCRFSEDPESFISEGNHELD